MTRAPKNGLFDRQDVDDDADIDVPNDDAPPQTGRRKKPSVSDLLPALVLDRALGVALKRRLASDCPLAVLVQAPGADWCAPLKRAAGALSQKALVVARDGSSRTSDRPDLGNDEVAAALRGGRHVLGISQAPPGKFLPSVLTTIADVRIVAKLRTPV